MGLPAHRPPPHHQPRPLYLPRRRWRLLPRPHPRRTAKPPALPHRHAVQSHRRRSLGAVRRRLAPTPAPLWLLRSHPGRYRGYHPRRSGTKLPPHGRRKHLGAFGRNDCRRPMDTSDRSPPLHRAGLLPRTPGLRNARALWTQPHQPFLPSLCPQRLQRSPSTCDTALFHRHEPFHRSYPLAPLDFCRPHRSHCRALLCARRTLPIHRGSLPGRTSDPPFL